MQYVELSAVIDLIANSMNDLDYYSETQELQDDIRRLPSIELQEGEWIELDCDEDKYDEIKCSCCKKTFVVDAYHLTDIGFVKDDFRFCPNCGNKKIEEGEDK